MHSSLIGKSQDNILYISSYVSFISSLVLIIPFIPQKTFSLYSFYCKKTLCSTYCIPHTVLRALNILTHLILTQTFFFWLCWGLHCCAWAFSSCGERGLLFVAVCGLLIVLASLVAEHGL